MKKLYNSPDALYTVFTKEDVCLKDSGEAGGNGDTANISIDFASKLSLDI